jgi:hypothetical protein
MAAWEALGRPLRALPRWGAALLLALLLAALAWSVSAMAGYKDRGEPRRAAAAEQTGGESTGDLALYQRINGRMEAGEGYYAAALAEQRTHNYPTIPFVTVRTPVLAWGWLLFGQLGWRLVASGLLIATTFAWIGALQGRTLFAERAAAALLLFTAGSGAFLERVGLLHDLLAGLCLSLALGLHRPHRWWPSWIAAALGLAIRELALPFVLLWAAIALAQRRWREFAAVAVLLGLFATGMALHASAVVAERLPGDVPSPGWHAMLGPALFLRSLTELTPPLVQLPPALAAPLALLPFVGWLGLGGRLGLFASLWFAGFALAMALFARENNFYWVMLVLPAYAAGMALVPRAIADLVAATARWRD